MEKSTVTEKSWEEFRSSGLLWFVNNMLHMFGWSIVIELDSETKEVSRVYPARVTFRGFSQEVNTKGYKSVSKYLKDNIDELLEEANE